MKWKWISTKKKLPPFKERVIVHHTSKWIGISYLADDKNFEWIDDDGLYMTHEGVTHWLPLPPSPLSDNVDEQNKTDKENFGSAHMENDDIMEMHIMRLNFFKKRNFTPSQMMAFLVTEFIGSLAQGGYSDVFVRKTLDHMYDSFLKHPMRKDKQ